MVQLHLWRADQHGAQQRAIRVHVVGRSGVPPASHSTDDPLSRSGASMIGARHGWLCGFLRPLAAPYAVVRPGDVARWAAVHDDPCNREVNVIAQTGDGSLWAGSQRGLFRLDGVD